MASDYCLVMVEMFEHPKGTVILLEDAENFLWLKAFEKNSVEATPGEVDKNTEFYKFDGARADNPPMCLTCDNVSFGFSSIGDNKDPSYACNLDYEIQNCGDDNVFGDELKWLYEKGKPFLVKQFNGEKFARFIVLWRVDYWQDHEGDWDSSMEPIDLVSTDEIAQFVRNREKPMNAPIVDNAPTASESNDLLGLSFD